MIVAVVLSGSERGERHQAELPAAQRTLLVESCFTCHDAKTQKGKVRLDDLPLAITTVAQADRWQKVLDALGSGDMPPEDEAQPTADRKADFLSALAETLVMARRALADSGGVITMRRLNRREYQNTMRVLLGVAVDGRDLPADEGAGTFDTVGASLFMSGDQIELYHRTAQAALREVLRRQRAAPAKAVTLKIEPEEAHNRRMRRALDDARARHERYRQWTAAVEAAAARPDNQEVIASLRKQVGITTVPPKSDQLRKLHRQWRQIPHAPSPSDFGFKDADDADFNGRHVWEDSGTAWQHYLDLPESGSGALLGYYHTVPHQQIDLPTAWAPGTYRIVYRLAALADAPMERRFVQFGIAGEGADAFDIFSTHQVTGTREAPQDLVVSVTLPPNGGRRFSLREKRDIQRDTGFRLHYTESVHKTGRPPRPAIWIDTVTVEGPLPEPVLPLVLPTTENEVAGTSLRSRIAEFATRAFRGVAPGEDFLDRLVTRYAERRTAGDEVAQAFIEVAAIVLAAPGFLYLSEPKPTTQVRSLDGRELAVRLAYFLWSAPPDDDLLASSISGRLKQPSELRRQVDRLLDDPRSSAFIEGFVSQWLGLARLDFFTFNTKLHTRFDESVKSAARREVFATVAWILRENRSLAELLASDTVVINGLLADFYGIDGVTGDEFRAVQLSPGSPRGGLLGMTAILAMGGNGDHTSPVERGAWILRKLLHDPPPPAPANVPQISRLEGKPLTTRERLLAHQEQPQCASCHRKIDPIGFGLENFDAVGRWRTEDSYQVSGAAVKRWTIDAAGAFHRGPTFTDFFALRRLIADHAPRFARGASEALIEYGLGRPAGFIDQDLADAMVAQSAKHDYRLRELLHALISSADFQHK